VQNSLYGNIFPFLTLRSFRKWVRRGAQVLRSFLQQTSHFVIDYQWQVVQKLDAKNIGDVQHSQLSGIVRAVSKYLALCRL